MIPFLVYGRKTGFAADVFRRYAIGSDHDKNFL